jgi:hypothetical protein
MTGKDDTALDIGSARSQLYGVAPAEFVTARSALVKQAKAAGDAGLAREIQAMRKPTAAAWLVNQLARQRRDELAELLDLGREMREDMGGLDADGLRDLTRRRHRLVSAMVALVRELAAANGQRLGDDVSRAVQTTLEATLSDAESAEAVREGNLSEPLTVSGFGAAFAFGAPPADGPVLRAVDSGEGAASVTVVGDRMWVLYG